MMGAMLDFMLNDLVSSFGVALSFDQCTCVFASCKASADSLRHHQSSTRSDSLKI